MYISAESFEKNIHEICSSLNGNNGEYTNTDDVKSTKQVSTKNNTTNQVEQKTTTPTTQAKQWRKKEEPASLLVGDSNAPQKTIAEISKELEQKSMAQPKVETETQTENNKPEPQSELRPTGPNPSSQIVITEIVQPNSDHAAQKSKRLRSYYPDEKLS